MLSEFWDSGFFTQPILAKVLQLRYFRAIHARTFQIGTNGSKRCYDACSIVSKTFGGCRHIFKSTPYIAITVIPGGLQKTI